MKCEKKDIKGKKILKIHIISTLSKTNIIVELYINCDKPEKNCNF